MNLHDLSPVDGSTHVGKRKGRGNGSGIKALCCQCSGCIAICGHPLSVRIVRTAGAAFDHIQHLDSPLFLYFPARRNCGHCPGSAGSPLPCPVTAKPYLLVIIA